VNIGNLQLAYLAVARYNKRASFFLKTGG